MSPPAAPYVDATALLPMYQPMSDFPAMKRTAVITAPGSQSGRTLKTAAKRNEISTRETNRFNADKTIPPNGSAALICAAKAVNAALTASETINRKPNAATSPRLLARAWTQRPTVVPFASAFQTLFSAACISPNTPDAVTISVMMPIAAAKKPEDLLFELATAVCRSSAVCPP